MGDIPWWKIERKNRHFVTNKESRVRTQHDPFVLLSKGSFVSPIRKKYLPYNHWLSESYDETKSVYADTPIGWALIDISDIDW